MVSSLGIVLEALCRCISIDVVYRAHPQLKLSPVGTSSSFKVGIEVDDTGRSPTSTSDHAHTHSCTAAAAKLQMRNNPDSTRYHWTTNTSWNLTGLEPREPLAIMASAGTVPWTWLWTPHHPQLSYYSFHTRRRQELRTSHRIL